MAIGIDRNLSFNSSRHKPSIEWDGFVHSFWKVKLGESFNVKLLYLKRKGFGEVYKVWRIWVFAIYHGHNEEFLKNGLKGFHNNHYDYSKSP